MNERNSNLPTRKTVLEEIDGLDYAKHEGQQELYYKFWLRFVHEPFKPCQECQEKLHESITQADHLYLGSKDYDPPVTLERHWYIIEDSWEEVERHEATKKDFINIYGAEKGETYWKDHLEIIEEK